MAKFRVFQINLSNDQIDEVNTSKDYPDFYKKYLATTFRPTAEAIVEARDMYTEVAVIDARNLEDVFNIGNIGPEDCIQRIKPMHSISVGDVVINELGIASVVASMGFTRVEFQA